MYLIDTSVWIDYFRNTNNKAVDFLIKIMQEELPFGITGIIYQEILQGAASKKDFNILAAHLETQRFFYPENAIITYKKAAALYFNCRKKGITLRSTVDCLIAQIAIEHHLVILHRDKDYLRIKKANPQLELVTLIKNELADV